MVCGEPLFHGNTGSHHHSSTTELSYSQYRKTGSIRPSERPITLRSHRQPWGCRVRLIHATSPRRSVPSNQSDMILVIPKHHRHISHDNDSVNLIYVSTQAARLPGILSLWLWPLFSLRCRSEKLALRDGQTETPSQCQRALSLPKLREALTT